MIVAVIIYLFLLIGALYLISLSKLTSNFESKSAKNVSFIIPFKNEALRLQPLIQSLNKAKWSQHIEVIFVDDHSTDRSVQLILDTVDIPFRLIRSREEKGKKTAITLGVLNATHDDIHTLDADVQFEKNFLINCTQLPNSDLTILPVELNGPTIFQKLNALEFQWLQTFTFSLTKLKKPTICNGANLSFSKKAFLNALDIRTDFNEPSGDDTYLLAAIKHNKGKITAFNSSNLLVKTDAPNGLKNLISQRKRWIRKVLNISSFAVLLVYIFYHLFPILFLLKLNESVLWLAPFILKVAIEFILSNRFSLKQFLLTVLHQFYYPFYGLILIIYLPFKVDWR